MLTWLTGSIDKILEFESLKLTHKRFSQTKHSRGLIICLIIPIKVILKDVNTANIVESSNLCLCRHIWDASNP